MESRQVYLVASLSTPESSIRSLWISPSCQLTYSSVRIRVRVGVVRKESILTEGE